MQSQISEQKQADNGKPNMTSDRDKSDHGEQRRRRKPAFEINAVSSDARLIDVQSVAAITGLGVRTILKLVSAAEFPPPIKIGTASRWKLSIVEEWVRKL